MKKLLTLLLLISLFTNKLFAQNGLNGAFYPNLPNIDLCTGIATDNSNRKWISYKPNPNAMNQSKSGLYLIDNNGILSRIRIDSLGGPISNYLSDIQFINGSLYCGSSAGLLNLGNGSSCSQMRYGSVNSQTDTVNAFIFYKNTWILGTQGGILIYNPSLNTWQLFNTSNSSLPTNQINAVARDSNFIWLGTDKGVIAFDPIANTSKSYTSLTSEFTSNWISSIACAPNGTVWAGGIGKKEVGLYLLKDGIFKNIESVAGYCHHSKMGGEYSYCSIGKISFHDNRVVFTGTESKNYAIYIKSNKLIKANESDINVIPISPIIYKTNPVYFGNGSASEFLFSEIKGDLLTLIIGQKIVSLSLNEIKLDTSFENKWKEVKDNFNKQKGSHDNNTHLSINNQKVPLNVQGDIFWDIWNNHNLSVDIGKCRIIAFAGSLWMGGMSDGNLYQAANTYRQSGIDFESGPLRLTNLPSDTITQAKFGRHWKVEERIIADFIAKRGTPGYKIPEEILSWPAHGDTLAGFAKNLAPFVDLNNNGIYEPVLGDYPNIKGQQDVFWIYNDGTLHTETEGNPLNIEIHANAYGYVCKDITDFHSNKAVNNTTFYSFKLINRSNRTYEGFRAGFWVDTELGSYSDDYIGSNPKQEYLYWYNADTSDMGPFGFGNRPPAAALVMLEGMKNPNGQNLKIGGVRYYDNDFGVQGNPSRPEHYYNYLTNRWKDGLAFTYGGNGRGGTDSDQVFMFSGINDPKSRMPWSEESTGNLGGDRRGIVHSQGITLAPGEEQTLVFAMVYTPALNRFTPEVLADLDLDVSKVRQWYAKDSFPSCSNIPLGIKRIGQNRDKMSLKIYPNPSQNEVNVEFTNQETIDCIKLFDLNGKLIWTSTKNLDTPIDISYLGSGIYFLQAFSERGSSVAKLIKN